MYNILYNKNGEINKGVFGNIQGICIDVNDILMIKNVESIPKADKNLINLYRKYLKNLTKDKNITDKYTILNNDNNKKIINSIIMSDWLINEDSILFNKDEYMRRYEIFQNIVNDLKDSSNIIDQSRCIIMQYYIDTIDKLYDKPKIKVLN